jgi:hypothetical protein
MNDLGAMTVWIDGTCHAKLSRYLPPVVHCHSRPWNTIERFGPELTKTLTGVAGAGKTSMLGRVTSHIDYNHSHHMSVGDAIRAVVARDQQSPNGSVLRKQRLAAGIPLDTDDLFETILEPEFLKFLASGRKLLMLDGFPRSTEQAEQFVKKVSSKCHSVACRDTLLTWQ